MNLRLHHAAQVFGEATEALVSSGSTRERLHLASQIIQGIIPKEFDAFPDLKAKYEEVHTRLSKVQDDPSLGSYRRSVDRMSGPKMRELCELVLDLDRSIRATE